MNGITLADAMQRTGGSAPLPTTAAGRLTDVLRHRIISLELPPDTVLSRTDLARDFDVSQTPLREAIQRLEDEGLVHVFPQSRTVVTRIDTEQIAEAHFLRVAVETEALRRLAPVCEEATAARLRMIVAIQETAAEAGDLTLFQDLDEVFHQTILSAAGQPGLHALLRARSGHLNRVRRLDLPDEGKVARILSGHRAIVDALAARDEAAALAAIREHLSQTIGRVELLRARHPDYFRA